MSIRKHPVAYLALFIALGGTSYAATQLPPNSVGTDQLAFPLGMTSINPPTQRIQASCDFGRKCVPRRVSLGLVRLSLKKSTRLLVLFHAGIVKYGSPARTSPLILQPTPGARDMRYPLSTSLTKINYSTVLSAPAGSNDGVGLYAYFYVPNSTRSAKTFVRVYNPQLTVIALPPLH